MQSVEVGYMWLLYSFMSMILWGVQGFFMKLALERLDWKQCLVATLLGATLICGFVWYKWQPLLVPRSPHWWSAVGAEVSGMMGVVFFYLALSSGKLSVVAPIGHLSLVITVLLACIVFKEPVSLTNWLGVFFAVLAVILVTR